MQIDNVIGTDDWPVPEPDLCTGELGILLHRRIPEVDDSFGSENVVASSKKTTIRVQVFSTEVERLVVAQTNRMFLDSMPWLPSVVLDGRSVQQVMPLDTDDGYGSAGAAAAPLPHLSKQAFYWARRSSILQAERSSSFLDPNPKLHHEKDVWWLIYGAITVGYWSTSLLRGLNHTAKLAVFGSDVYSPKITQAPHTAIKMCFGAFGVNTDELGT